MRDSHVGAQIAANYDVVTCGESTLCSVVPDCQRGRCGVTHRPNISCLAHCTDCIGCRSLPVKRHDPRQCARRSGAPVTTQRVRV